MPYRIRVVRLFKASLLFFTLCLKATTLYAEETPQTAPDFVDVFLDEDANCQARDSQHVSVRNTHPAKTVRVWLDRYYRGHYTGDRSRSDLVPNAEPDSLGCATISGGRQEWRVVRAIFLD